MDSKGYFESPNPFDGEAKLFAASANQEIRLLTEESLRLIPDIIKLFYRLYVNAPLYPPGSEMVVEPLQELHEKLSDIFTRDDKVIFTSIKNNLVVNGQRLKEGEIKRTFEETFLKLFENLILETITFQKGLTQPELSKFAGLLNRGLEQKTLSSFLKEEGIEHVSLNEIDFRIASEGQKAPGGKYNFKDIVLMEYVTSKLLTIAQSGDILQKLESNPKEMADTLAQLSANALQQHGAIEATESVQAGMILELLLTLGNQLVDKDPKSWEVTKKGFAKTLSNLKPTLQKKVFLNPKSSEQENLLRELLPEFSNDTVVKMLVDAYKEKQASVEQIRSAVRRLVKDKDQKESLMSSLSGPLSESGLPQEDLQWISGAQTFSSLSLDKKIEKILNISLDDYLLLRSEIDIVAFVEEIIRQGRIDSLKAVVDRWNHFYREATGDVKRDMGEDILKVIEGFPDYPDEAVGRVLDLSMAPFSKENILQNFKASSVLLTGALRRWIDSGKPGTAGKIWHKLKNDLSAPGENTEFSDFVKLAQKGIFTSDRIKSIIGEYLKRAVKGGGVTDIAVLLIDLGESAVDILIAEVMIDEKTLKAIGYFDAYLRRRTIGKILVEIMHRTDGKMIHQLLLTSLKSPQWYVVKNTVELLAEIHHEKAVGLLAFSINHEDPRVRKKTVFALSKIGGPQSLSVLAEALKGNKGDVLLDIITVLGKIGDARILDELKGFKVDKFQSEINKSIRAIEERLKKNEQRSS